MQKLDLQNGASLISFESDQPGGHNIASAQNFSVEWITEHNRSVSLTSSAETILILSEGHVRLVHEHETVELPASSIAIVPAGNSQVTLTAGGLLLALATDRPDLEQAGGIIPSRIHNDRITPIGAPFERNKPLERPLIIPFDAIPNPSGNPRIRFFQSATMSINLVRYEGSRDTKALSPHAHKDIEQGTLAIRGRYVHHLRTQWGPDKENWRDDSHVEVGSGTLLLIPPELVHTTEGIGPEAHLLLDIFAPPRRDFIAKGWIANANDYRDPISNADR